MKPLWRREIIGKWSTLFLRLSQSNCKLPKIEFQLVQSFTKANNKKTDTWPPKIPALSVERETTLSVETNCLSSKGSVYHISYQLECSMWHLMAKVYFSKLSLHFNKDTSRTLQQVQRNAHAHVHCKQQKNEVWCIMIWNFFLVYWFLATLWKCSCCPNGCREVCNKQTSLCSHIWPYAHKRIIFLSTLKEIVIWTLKLHWI